MDSEGICLGVWTGVCQDSDHWWAFVNVVINIWVPVNLGNLLTS